MLQKALPASNANHLQAYKPPRSYISAPDQRQKPLSTPPPFARTITTKSPPPIHPSSFDPFPTLSLHHTTLHTPPPCPPLYPSHIHPIPNSLHKHTTSKPNTIHPPKHLTSTESRRMHHLLSSGVFNITERLFKKPSPSLSHGRLLLKHGFASESAVNIG